MDAITDDRLPSRPATGAGTENAAVTAQVVGTGMQEKDGVVEAIAGDKGVSVKAKSVPQAGLKNYFVSRHRSFQIHC